MNYCLFIPFYQQNFNDFGTKKCDLIKKRFKS